MFFTDVEVPAENLVGELNRGWAMAQGSLGHERGMLWIGSVANVERGVEALVELGDEKGADGQRLGDDTRFRDAVASLYIDSQAQRFLGYRGFAKFARGEPAPEHTILKLFTSETERRRLPHRASRRSGPTASTTTASGRRCGATARGRCSTCARSRAPSPAARPRSSATSSPSGSSASPLTVVDDRLARAIAAIDAANADDPNTILVRRRRAGPRSWRTPS